jgi:hypothetical protein
MAIVWPVSAIASIILLFGLQAILLGRQVNCAVELNPTILLSGLFDLEYYQSSPPYTSRCTGLLLIGIAWLAIAIATKPASHCLADHLAPGAALIADMVNRALARAGGTKLAYVPTVYW